MINPTENKTTGDVSHSKKKKKKNSGFSFQRMMLDIALWFAPNYVKMAEKKNAPIFLTIKLSHYCELARWALDRQGIQYKEATYLPVTHITATIKARRALGFSGKSTTSTPLLILPPHDGLPSKGVGSSFLIAEWAGLPVQADWIDELDNQVGPAVRRLGYDDILFRPDAVTKTMSIGTWKERFGFNLVRSTIVKTMIKEMLVTPKTYKPEPAIEVKLSKSGEPLPTKFGDEKIIRRLLERSAAVLLESPYLDGEELGGTDLAVACLLAPLLNPKGYGGRLGAIMKAEMEPSEFLDSVKNSVTGKHCLKLFVEERFKMTDGRRLSTAMSM